MMSLCKRVLPVRHSPGGGGLLKSHWSTAGSISHSRAGYCHSRGSGNPRDLLYKVLHNWTPASVGVTMFFKKAMNLQMGIHLGMFSICFCTLLPYGGFAVYGVKPALSLKNRGSYFSSGYGRRALKSTLVRCQSVMSRTGRSAVVRLKRDQTLKKEVLTNKGRREGIPLIEGDLRNTDFRPSYPPDKWDYFMNRPQGFFPPLKVLPRVQVPPARETEAELKAKGFENHYTAGMDEVHRMQVIAHALRGNQVDPDRTHIEDFAAQVEGHIAFFNRPGRLTERESQFPSLKKQMPDRGAMKTLSREARQRVKEQKVTYNWWMQWNLKMLDTVDSNINLQLYLTNYSKLNLSFNDPFLSMARGAFKKGRFDEGDTVYLPTTEELEVMAFNQASSKKLVPLALSDRPAFTDGAVECPIEFFLHDLSHGTDDFTRKLVDSAKYKNFHRAFKKKVRKLPTSQRKKVELMLFLLTHEYSGFRSPDNFVNLLDVYPVHHHYVQTHYLRLDKEGDMGHLLPPALQAAPQERVLEYFVSAMEGFEEVAREIQKESFNGMR